MMAAGWFGKIPSTGDFVVRRLPGAFREPWDRWLQESLDGSRERLGQRWRESYLSMPAWRFALSPGLLSAEAWTGILVASVDAVGRQFPLTIACALPGTGIQLPALFTTAAGWFERIESLALEALAQRASADNIDAGVSAAAFRDDWLERREEAADATVPFRSARAQMLVVAPQELQAAALQIAEPASLWLAGESELMERRALLCEGLPGPAHFCGMMDGRWREHGWTERDPHGAAAA